MANYLYISKSPDARRNMAYDEWFLDNVGMDDLILCFYVNKNAVIIGKNQNPYIECRLEEMERDGVQLARRVSGGGAVYHDEGNLNFSFIAGKDRFDKDRQHRLILEVVRDLGIPCEFSGRNDLLVDGKKFSGNAYCARGDRKLHHGTLLVSSDPSKLPSYLNPDPAKLRSKGVASVRSRVCNLNEFCPELTVAQLKKIIPEAIGKVYGAFSRLRLTPQDRAAIAPYVRKHRSKEWRYGVTPAFDYEIACRLSFGSVRTLLSLEGCAVFSSKTYTDANDDTLAERIDRALVGAAFSPAALASALKKDGSPELSEYAGYIETLHF